jgi:hypothetical protein
MRSLPNRGNRHLPRGTKKTTKNLSDYPISRTRFEWNNPKYESRPLLLRQEIQLSDIKVNNWPGIRASLIQQTFKEYISAAQGLYGEIQSQEIKRGRW